MKTIADAFGFYRNHFAKKVLVSLAVMMFVELGMISLPCHAAKDDKKSTSKAENEKRAEKPNKPAEASKAADNRYGPSLDGKARTSMFGVEGVGYKFVYVIDRSGSMGGDGNATLKAAKAELLASINKLESTHAFQIVFYNERPATFNPKGNGLAVFATDRNKELAEHFLDSISAQGGTEHEAALKIAFKLKPDVIFWLTDGDRPKLDDAQLERINRLAAGTVIQTIEFGSGAQKEKGNFLQKIAEGNAGEYHYVDAQKLVP